MALKSLKSMRIFLASLLMLLLPLGAALADGLSKEQAIREAQSRNGGGKVLGVSESSKNGKKVFSVKLISNGKVRIIKITDR